MRTPEVPVENLAEIFWGALLIIYLAGAGRPEFLSPPVLTIFAVSAAGAMIEVYLRRIRWRWLILYDSVVWTILLSAMVAVTGGRGSEVWPAYMLMSLTAPSIGRRTVLYTLMTANSLLYAGIYLWVNPFGVPFQPALLTLRIGLFLLVTYVVDRSMEREREARQELIDAAQSRVAELLSARDVERRRIAGDIHDWLGSGIVAPMRQLELALRAPDLEAARQKAAVALESLRSSHEELRRLMENLHPHLLEQLGLTEALQAYLTQWTSQNGVEAQLLPDDGPEPPPDVSLALFRIMQEALNNVAKHANAGSVEITLKTTEQSVHLEVVDDGSGFSNPSPGGRGLAGMRERAAVFGGTLTVQSAPGAGTTIRAEIPCRA